MVDTVAQQVGKRVLHELENALVELDILTTDREVGLLALISAKIAHHLGERGRSRGERQQQQLLGTLQQP